MNLSQLTVYLTGLLITGMSTCSAPALQAQENAAPAFNKSLSPPQLDPVQAGQTSSPDGEKSFSQTIAEIRNNEKRINQLFSSIPIGFPEKQQKFLDEIEALRATNAKLQGTLESAALRSFRADPANNPQATQLVFTMIGRKLDGTSGQEYFDPQGALELAELMLNARLDVGPINLQDVAYQAFRASFAVQDFTRADRMLKKIEALGIPLNPMIRQQLVESQKKWQRELMIRELESKTDDLPRVKLETSEGDIVLELFENHAPETVGNFVSLVEKNFYHDLPFFQVRPAEFAKTGCPLGNGTGDAGYQIPCECYREEVRHHFTGTVSMSNSGRDTGGSMFFITHQRNPEFDGKYTAFGRVIEGMDVVYRLKSSSGTLGDAERSKIIKATVLRKRDHAYGPTRIAKNNQNKVGAAEVRPPLDSPGNLKPGG